MVFRCSRRYASFRHAGYLLAFSRPRDLIERSGFEENEWYPREVRSRRRPECSRASFCKRISWAIEHWADRSVRMQFDAGAGRLRCFANACPVVSDSGKGSGASAISQYACRHDRETAAIEYAESMPIVVSACVLFDLLVMEFCSLSMRKPSIG